MHARLLRDRALIAYFVEVMAQYEAAGTQGNEGHGCPEFAKGSM